jgi:invasion protein IalB
MKRTLILFSLIATCAAFGGGAVEAAGDPRATQLTHERWNKTCLKQVDGKADCWVSAGARGTCNPSGGVISIRILDDNSASLFASLNTKRELEGAISVQIDQGDPILIPHPECIGPGCGGRFDIHSGFIERLKSGQTITLEATNTTHQKISLSLSLADFAKAYDGPGQEPKVFEQVLTSEEMKEVMGRAEKEKPPQCED